MTRHRRNEILIPFMVASCRFFFLTVFVPAGSPSIDVTTFVCDAFPRNAHLNPTALAVRRGPRVQPQREKHAIRTERVRIAEYAQITPEVAVGH